MKLEFVDELNIHINNHLVSQSAINLQSAPPSVSDTVCLTIRSEKLSGVNIDLSLVVMAEII